MLINSVFYDVSLVCKVVFQVLRLCTQKPVRASVRCMMVCSYLVKGRYFYIALVKGGASLYFAMLCMVTFVYDVFYAVRIYIRIGY